MFTRKHSACYFGFRVDTPTRLLKEKALPRASNTPASLRTRAKHRALSDTPKSLNGTFGFRYGKNSPLRIATQFSPPPLFASARLRGVNQVWARVRLRRSFVASQQPIILICPALRAVHHPPVPCASHPPVPCTCGLRVPLGHFGSSLRSDLLRSAGREGSQESPLKFQI
jgi:hypothetical protein